MARAIRVATRFALIVLAIIGAAHIATIWLRPDVRGMDPSACQAGDGGKLAAAGLWLRYFAGDTPVFDDWPGACAFAAQNAELRKSGQRPDIVFIGDSITQHWLAADPAMFNQTRLNRGIPGNSTAQVLTRFPSDVVALHPRAVHLLTGTNDVLGLRGPTTPEIWQGTMRAIVDVARAEGIVVILGTLPPLRENGYDMAHRPAPIVAEQNRWLRDLAKEKGLILADYHSVLTTEDGGFKPDLSVDGTHPNAAGFAAMRKVLDQALAQLPPPAKN